jgi:hypothetical protein
MATQEFTVTNHFGKQERYNPQRVKYNGVNGHIWKRWVLERDCWVFQGQQFHHIKATRNQIAENAPQHLNT